MTKKYKSVRVPVETYNIIRVKKVKMEERIKELTGRQESIPITRVIRVLANRSVTVMDREVKKMGRKKKKCEVY